jgi:hypothetical protein
VSDINTQNPPTPGSSPGGLPPVAPPSGRFIVQLFVVPGLIVGVIVLVLLTGKWIFGDRGSPETFLKGLDDPNPEVRWRAAADLAQVLPRDPAMALNTGFALDLAERLQRAWENNRDDEKTRLEQVKKARGEPPPAPKTLLAEREHIWYLTSCLGHFQVPVGAPVLQKIALEKTGGEEEAIFRGRARAAQALVILGRNLEVFDGLPAEKKRRVLAELREKSDSDTQRGRWAKDTLAFLEAREEGKKPSTLLVADTLIELSKDKIAFLRKQAAVGLNFWDGDGVEEALLRLVKDNGEGPEPAQFDEKEQKYRDSHREELVRQNRTDIAYNAAVALARRGSPAAEGLFDLYAEMLDLKKQEQIQRSEWQPGSEKANAVLVVVYTLKALDHLRAARPKLTFPPSIRKAIDALVDSDNTTVSATAKELQAKLK